MANQPPQPPMDLDAQSAGDPVPAGTGGKRARPQLELSEEQLRALADLLGDRLGRAAPAAVASAAPPPSAAEVEQREEKEAREFTWATLAEPVERLPPVEDLKAFLAGPFAEGRRLPVPSRPSDKSPLEVPDTLKDNFFVAAPQFVDGDDVSLVRNMLKWHASMNRGSEMFRGRVPYVMVQSPLEKILGISDERPAKRRLTADVNSALSSSTSTSSAAGAAGEHVARGSTATFGRWRPDYMISVDDGNGTAYTPFVGEEKPQSCEQAKADLMRKFNYEVGELGTLAPYLLAYSFANSRLEYHAILPGGTLVAVAGPFDVSHPQDRFQLARATVNLARLIRPLADALVQGQGRFLVKQLRAHDVTVAVGRDHVVKEVNMGAHQQAMANRKPARSSWYGDHLYEFYAALQNAEAHPSIPTFQVGPRRSDSILRLSIKPVLHELPVDLSVRECIHLMADVASALAHLHKLGWCHRDVRRPNIMREGAEGGRFFLIDYEMANKAGQPILWTPTAKPSDDAGWKEEWQRKHDFQMLNKTVRALMKEPSDMNELALSQELPAVMFGLAQPRANIPATLVQLEALRAKALLP